MKSNAQLLSQKFDTRTRSKQQSLIDPSLTTFPSLHVLMHLDFIQLPTEFKYPDQFLTGLFNQVQPCLTLDPFPNHNANRAG